MRQERAGMHNDEEMSYGIAMRGGSLREMSAVAWQQVGEELFEELSRGRI